MLKGSNNYIEWMCDSILWRWNKLILCPNFVGVIAHAHIINFEIVIQYYHKYRWLWVFIVTFINTTSGIWRRKLR